MSDPSDDIEKIFTGSVPQDITASALAKVLRKAMAEALMRVSMEGDGFVMGAHLGDAVGAYLDLHARDRGLRRATDETDDQLRERLRIPPAAVTVSAIRTAILNILGLTSGVYIVELPKHSLYYDRAAAEPNTHPNSYDRGSRLGGYRGVVVVLIPSGTGAISSIQDAVRKKIAAGKSFIVEEYDAS